MHRALVCSPPLSRWDAAPTARVCACEGMLITASSLHPRRTSLRRTAFGRTVAGDHVAKEYRHGIPAPVSQGLRRVRGSRSHSFGPGQRESGSRLALPPPVDDDAGVFDKLEKKLLAL